MSSEIDYSLEDPIGVCKKILEKEWTTKYGGETPDIYLLREQNQQPPGLTDKGSIWLAEQPPEEDRTADALREHDDVRLPFVAEIRAKTYERMQQIYLQVNKIQKNNLTDPGKNLTPPDTTFDDWEVKGPPVVDNQRNRYVRLLNYEFVIWNKRIR